MQRSCYKSNLFQVKKNKERSNIKNNEIEENILKEFFTYKQSHYLYELEFS